MVEILALTLWIFQPISAYYHWKTKNELHLLKNANLVPNEIKTTEIILFVLVIFLYIFEFYKFFVKSKEKNEESI